MRDDFLYRFSNRFFSSGPDLNREYFGRTYFVANSALNTNILIDRVESFLLPTDRFNRTILPAQTTSNAAIQNVEADECFTLFCRAGIIVDVGFILIPEVTNCC